MRPGQSCARRWSVTHVSLRSLEALADDVPSAPRRWNERRKDIVGAKHFGELTRLLDWGCDDARPRHRPSPRALTVFGSIAEPSLRKRQSERRGNPTRCGAREVGPRNAHKVRALHSNVGATRHNPLGKMECKAARLFFQDPPQALSHFSVWREYSLLR
jgi:hypothetical protein